MFFDRLRESFHFGRYRKVKELIGRPAGTLLDIGCGRPCDSMGDFAFLGYLGGGIGADLKKCPRPPSGCLFVESDMLALPFRPGAFDVIVAMEVIEHIKDIDGALKSVAGALAVGGTFVATTPANNLAWRAVWFVWVRTFGGMWHDAHKTNLTQEEWVRRLGEHFEVVEVRRHWLIDLVIKMRRRPD
jgi:SAM-dependent methyltransferase